MRSPFLRPAAIAAVLLAVAAPAVRAQAVPSLALVRATSLVTDVTRPGCWLCVTNTAGGYCDGGNIPGYWTCSSFPGWCVTYMPACGAGASLPLDPDGAAQYVSRGALVGLDLAMHAAGEVARTNCDGVIVARVQSAAEVGAVRARTTTLTL